MKKVIQRIPLTITIIFLLTILLSGSGTAAPPTSGQDQLVDALDAAIVRIIDSGELREIMKPVESYAVYISDCYPSLEETAYPGNPVGILAEILKNREIKVGTFITEGASGSYDIFLPINDAILEAVIAELSKGYNLDPPIEIKRVWMWPPSSNLMFANLNRGDFHISDLSGAIGGTATVSEESQRRRKISRFTCTIESSGWYLQVKEDSAYETFQDMVDDGTATVCCGMMSQRLAQAYFKDQTIKRITIDDLDLCSDGVLAGTYAAYLHFDPAPVKTGLRSINTGLVSGVPIWVAGGSDNATNPGSVGPRQIDKCKVEAGTDDKGDSLQFAGLLDATEDDFFEADSVNVTISVDDVPILEQAFEINEDSFKKGKYKSPKKPIEKGDPVTKLQIDTIKGTIKFSGKNLDLTGLGCPITVTIQIGSYVAELEPGE